MNIGNILLTIGFVLIITYAGVNYYASLNVATNNPNFIDLTGLNNNTDEYNALYVTEHERITDPSNDVQVSSFGDLIFGAGYSSLKNVLAGNWLVVTTNIFVTSIGFSPIDPVIIGILITLIGLIFLLIVLGALMNRVFVQR